MRNLPNLTQNLSTDDEVFHEFDISKYLGVLITGEHEISEEIKMTVNTGCRRFYGSQYIRLTQN
jgi:hypothetical protein